MGKIALTKDKTNMIRRKIAIGTWSQPKDCQVYGHIDLDVTELMPKLKEYSEKVGTKITINHVIGKISAYAFKHRPELNGLIRGSKVYRRKHTKLCYLVNIPSKDGDISKNNLSACGIDQVENKTIVEIAQEMEKKASDVREGRDKELKQNMDAFRIIPWCLVKAYLNFASFLIYGLNMNLGWLGIPKDPFGSVIITNIGSLGIDLAWPPLVPYARTPVLFTICKAVDRPWVVDGEIKIRKIMPLTCTFDHRFVDGVQMAKMADMFKMCIAEPEKYLLDG